jgi:hypothetical protein
MEEAGPMTIATNLELVTSVLVPKTPGMVELVDEPISNVAENENGGVVSQIEITRDSIVAGRILKSRQNFMFSPSDQARHESQSVGNLDCRSLQHQAAYAAETTEEREILATAAAAFQKSTGVKPFVYFVTERDDGRRDVHNHKKKIYAAAGDDSHDHDHDHDDEENQTPARRLIGFDPIDGVDGKKLLQRFWGESCPEDAALRMDKLAAALERSENKSFYFCPSCVATSGTCRFFGHAHSLLVAKNSAVYLKCQRMHTARKRTSMEDDTTSAKLHMEKPSTAESMFRLGITQFPGFSHREQECVNEWYAETESGLMPLNQKCLRRGHGQAATVRRFITEHLRTDNLYLGRGEGFVCVTRDEEDQTKRKLAYLSTLATCYADATGRFVDVRLNSKGVPTIENHTQPPPFFDDLIRSALLHGQPDISLKLPTLQYLSYVPVVCPDGTVHCTEGMAPGTTVYCAWAHGDVNAQPLSHNDVKILADDFEKLFGKFAWRRICEGSCLEESACLVWVTCAAQRHLIACGIVDLLLSAGGKNAGKSTLAELLQMLAINTLGTSVPTVKETPTSRTVTIAEQTFNTVFNDGTSQVLAMGNVEDNCQFQSAALEDAKTKDKISFRGYHTQKLKHASARLAMLVDGNGIEMMDGLTRRFLELLLESGSTRAAMGLPDEHCFKNDIDADRTAVFPRTARTIALLFARLVSMARGDQVLLLAEFHAAGHKVCLQGSLERPGDVHFDLVRAILWKSLGAVCTWYVDPFDQMMEASVGVGSEVDAHALAVAQCYNALSDLQRVEAFSIDIQQRLTAIVDHGEPFSWSELLEFIRPEHNPYLSDVPPGVAPCSAADASQSLVSALSAFKKDTGIARIPHTGMHVALKELTGRHTLCPKFKRFLDKVVPVSGPARAVRLIEYGAGTKGKARMFRFDELAAAGKRKR